MRFNVPALLLLATAVLSAQSGPRSGIDRANLDPRCKPCTDFWRYANGGWLDRNPIPARFSKWGTFDVLTESNRERLRAILEAAAANTSAKPDSNERKIGDLYASCMDTAAIDARGIQPIQPDLDRISAVHSLKDLVAVLTEFQRTVRAGPLVFGPFFISAHPDEKNSKETIADIADIALSLPNRDYYSGEDVKFRESVRSF